MGFPSYPPVIVHIAGLITISNRWSANRSFPIATCTFDFVGLKVVTNKPTTLPKDWWVLLHGKLPDQETVVGWPMVVQRVETWVLGWDGSDQTTEASRVGKDDFDVKKDKRMISNNNIKHHKTTIFALLVIYHSHSFPTGENNHFVGVCAMLLAASPKQRQ